MTTIVHLSLASSEVMPAFEMKLSLWDVKIQKSWFSLQLYVEEKEKKWSTLESAAVRVRHGKQVSSLCLADWSDGSNKGSVLLSQWGVMYGYQTAGDSLLFAVKLCSSNFDKMDERTRQASRTHSSKYNTHPSFSDFVFTFWTTQLTGPKFDWVPPQSLNTLSSCSCI